MTGAVEDRARRAPGSAGFSLVEAMVATIIATIAVVGLAYSFGLGRSFINRFEVARAAMAVAQDRLDILHVTRRSADDFSPDSVHIRPFNHAGRETGVEQWTVAWYDDPATPTSDDLKKVTVTVRWTQGSLTDSISLSRLFLPTN